MSAEKISIFRSKKNVYNPELIGGVIVLFENLLEYCDEYHIEYDVIDTNKANYKNKLYAYIQILILLFKKVGKSTHISLHGTANDYLLIAPFALLVSKCFGKHFSLRKFAGNFIEIYENYSTLQRFIINMTLKYSSCNFFETKYLVEYFKKFNPNTFWFPNVRKKSLYHTGEKFRKKFVYLGAVKKEKGIDILCEASNLLSAEYTIDIFGALYDGYEESTFEKFNVRYRGVLNNGMVIDKLLTYDVLILPSLREGYPGVIIEALSIGMPIIATNLPSIQEMVDDSSSILIEPLNVVQLKEAIEFFDIYNYEGKLQNALQQFKKFDSEIQTNLFFKWINNNA